MTNTEPLVHATTSRTDDAVAWLAARFPNDDDLTVAHTNSCDQVSCGNACEGGCPVIAR